MDAQELSRIAINAGWTVTGHRWLRITKRDTQIVVWFAGTKPRMVSAELSSGSGQSAHLDIVHDRATSLPDTVRSWLTTPLHGVDLIRTTARPPRRPGRNGRVARNVAVFV